MYRRNASCDLSRSHLGSLREHDVADELLESSAGRKQAIRAAVSFGPKLLARDDILKFYAAEEQVYGPHASLHNDEAAAKAAGLADIIAPGRYSLGLVSCMLGGLHRDRCSGCQDR